MKAKEASSIAVSLGTNIHASASENIISSLFAAALNESNSLRKWLLREARLHARRSVNMRAVPSCDLPRVFTRRAWRRKPHRRICVDVMLWNHNCDRQWSVFEDPRTLDPTAGADDLYGVYVEVKHDTLNRGDKDKYCRCAEALRTVNSEISPDADKDQVHFAYLVVSSHNPIAKARIARSGGKTQNDRNWHKIMNDPNIRHITTQEIYDEIRHYRGGGDMLKIFREYLRFLNDPTSVDRWKEELAYFDRSNDDTRKWVKHSIYWAIRDLGRAAGFADSHTPAEASSVASITFNADNHKLKVRRGSDSRLVKKLCVEFEGTATSRMRRVDFADIVAGLGRHTAKAEQDEIAAGIESKLEQVRRKLDRLMAEAQQ